MIHFFSLNFFRENAPYRHFVSTFYTCFQCIKRQFKQAAFIISFYSLFVYLIPFSEDCYNSLIRFYGRRVGKTKGKFCLPIHNTKQGISVGTHTGAFPIDRCTEIIRKHILGRINGRLRITGSLYRNHIAHRIQIHSCRISLTLFIAALRLIKALFIPGNLVNPGKSYRRIGQRHLNLFLWIDHRSGLLGKLHQ